MAMNGRLCNRLICITICALLATAEVHAQPAPNSGLGFDFHIGRDIGLASVGLGATVGLGIYLARRGHHLTGCVSPDGRGMQLTTSSDRETFGLVGDLGAVKAGELVRIEGKKKGKDASGRRSFLVKGVSKDFGACEMRAAK